MSLQIEGKAVVFNPRSVSPPAPSGPPVVKMPHRWPMVVIGIDKLVKGVGLIILGFVLHYVLSPERRQEVFDFVNNVRLEPRNFYLTWVLEKVLAVKIQTLSMFRIGCFAYAALYFVEGFGVLWEKEWAEWVIVISTSLFLPLELYEICKDVTWGRVLLFVANIAIMVYLCFRIRTQKRIKHAKELGLEVQQPAKLTKASNPT